jgi:hypothetical protein
MEGKALSVGAAMLVEQEHLHDLAEEGFDLVERSYPTVDGFSCVRVRTNRYSVPARVGAQVEARIRPSHIEIWHDGHCIAKHERNYQRQQQVLELEHYLDTLEKKPGALAGSKPLAIWREKGLWSECMDHLWDELNRRHGKSSGTKKMISLLQLGREHGYNRLRQAVEAALATGCCDVAAVEYLLTVELYPPSPEPLIEMGLLARYERPLPSVLEYDQLLSAGGAA